MVTIPVIIHLIWDTIFWIRESAPENVNILISNHMAEPMFGLRQIDSCYRQDSIQPTSFLYDLETVSFAIFAPLAIAAYWYLSEIWVTFIDLSSSICEAQTKPSGLHPSMALSFCYSTTVPESTYARSSTPSILAFSNWRIAFVLSRLSDFFSAIRALMTSKYNYPNRLYKCNRSANPTV